MNINKPTRFIEEGIHEYTHTNKTFTEEERRKRPKNIQSKKTYTGEETH